MSEGLARRATRDLAALDRRGFLRLAAALGVTGALPGCRAAPPELAPPPGVALQHLTPRSYAVLQAASARVGGPQVAALVRAKRLAPARAAESFLASAPELAGLLRQALLLLEFAPWPLLAKWRAFTALEGTAQDARLAELAGSRLALKRQLFQGVRSVSLLGVYGALAEARLADVALGALPPDASIAEAMTYPPAPGD